MTDKSISFERARPVFDRTRRRFNPLVRLAGIEAGERAVTLELRTKDDMAAFGRITFADPEVARVHWSVGAPPGPHTTEMLVAEPPELPLRVTEDEHAVTVDAGGTPLVLWRYPWRVEFGPYSSEPNDQMFFQAVSEPTGWAVDVEDETLSCYDTFALRPGEHLYGLGERFVGPDLRGRRLSHWVAEGFGTNTTDRVYKSVPLVVSSHGYGVFYHHPEEATFDLGASSNASATVLVEAGSLDQFLILGTPKEILTRYTALTGRPPVLPEWTHGIWLSRCMYDSREQVMDVVETARKLGFPVDVVHLDPKWMVNGAANDAYGCDFEWNEADFGPLEDLVAWLHERGVRLCLWINPYMQETSPAFRPEHLVEGGRARDRDYPVRGFVDFTGPGATWWETRLRALVDAGVDAFKLDFAESLPADARMADGRRGAEVHNLYPLLASATAARAGAVVHFTRSGTAGSQRFPLHWSGDAQASWAGLAGALRGGLAAAWSGFCHWTSDAGGFYWRDVFDTSGPFVMKQPDTELYIRWMQFAMLCSHTRFHGVGPREPWAFGDEAVAVARRFADLRTALRPYLLRCAQEAADQGWPVLRPMAFEFPDDPAARTVDTQYMLGPDVVVTPVLQPGGVVEQYVPQGTWHDHFTGEELVGPLWRRVEVPLDRAAILTRAGTRPFGA